jgi:hypothetical protein
MSATIFRKVGLCLFVCFASVRNNSNIVYELFVLFDHFLPLY